MRAPGKEEIINVRTRILGLFRGRGLWLWLALFVIGLLIGEAGIIEPKTTLWTVPIFITVLLAVSLRVKGVGPTVWLLACALCLGLMRQGQSQMQLTESASLMPLTGSEKVRLLFRPDRAPERAPGYTVFWGMIEAINTGQDWTSTRTRTRLAVGDDVPQIHRGDRIVVLAKLAQPRAFKNPGGFDYHAYLARRGVMATAYARSTDDLVKVGADGWTGVLGAIDRLRESYLQRLRRGQGDGADLMRALLAGDREALSPEVTDAFRDAGLSHVLAISGLHIGLVAFGFFYLAKLIAVRSTWLLNRFSDVQAAAIAAIPAVIAYAVLTGMRVPTQRALIMALTYLIAIALDRRREVWNALALAAVVVLIAWPEALYEISFQMSFLCVAGILYAYPRVHAIVWGPQSLAESELDRLEFTMGVAGSGALRTILQYFSGLLVISVIAHWSIFPLLANYFHMTNPVSPLYNLVVVPVVGFLLIPLGVLASLAYLVSNWLGDVIMILPAAIAQIMVEGVIYCDSSLRTVTLLPRLSAVGIVAWYAAGGTLVEAALALRCGSWSWRYFSPAHVRFLRLDGWAPPIPAAARPSALIVGGVGLLLLGAAVTDLTRSRDPFPDGSSVLAAIDVGQGQSLLYRTVEGRYLLIDGGGFYKSGFDVGQGVVGPCLLALGVRRLEAVVLSHPHPDHAGGLAFILRHFKVKEFWRTSDTNKATEKLDAIARERGVTIRIMDESIGGIDFHGARVRVINPPVDRNALGDNLNNRSLVLSLTSGANSMLLTGDVEKEAEALLVGKYGPVGSVAPDALRSKVLVVPHHGSKSSSTEEFLEVVGADYAMVSAGGYDFMRLPAKKIMARYESRGIRVLRTDVQGWSALVMNGDSVQIHGGHSIVAAPWF